ncbi:hypothetical protein Asulf_01931 [Archaeoglobus sulfaticallidus PM70-1]|uniref:Uncharacterized protein n=1 Tax=Archaeoglobus sulfaticallidus PM70-1 TaxID=387631 RepID=N0BHW1_9EURY|nr:dual specificity protein phosphatase family protein [Archaeoglobus sulfaticallidus]AGK61897.1 hypothetical protein Asulf_01931 [Archaeoglobus sulfaticallidus PM70-1]
MPLNNFRVIIDGKLAGMGLPDREALIQLKDMGFKGILTLTEKPLMYDEIRYFQYHHIPLKNFKAPYLDQMVEAVEFIDNVDGPVAVHCQFGKGKTGCILGAYLIYKFNMCTDEVIRRLKAIFNSYIELSEQVEALKDFERFLRTKSYYEDGCSGKIIVKRDYSMFEECIHHFKVCVYEDETEMILKTDSGEIVLSFKGDIGRKMTKSICHL